MYIVVKLKLKKKYQFCGVSKYASVQQYIHRDEEILIIIANYLNSPMPNIVEQGQSSVI